MAIEDYVKDNTVERIYSEVHQHADNFDNDQRVDWVEWLDTLGRLMEGHIPRFGKVANGMMAPCMSDGR
jgi:hypothetical protein